MKSERSRLYGVISGDVVSSIAVINERKILIGDILERAFADADKAFPDTLPLPVDVYAGDSWQLLVSEPIKSLRIGIHFRAHLKAIEIDTRVAIAIGKIDSFPQTRVSGGLGEAYINSGRALADLKNSRHDRLKVVLPDMEQQKAVDAIVGFIDALITGWSPSQAAAVTGKLKGLTQKEIAAHWKPDPIAQQTVGMHLRRAEWKLLSKGTEAAESVIRKATGCKEP